MGRVIFTVEDGGDIFMERVTKEIRLKVCDECLIQDEAISLRRYEKKKSNRFPKSKNAAMPFKLVKTLA